jgi:NADPH2:quinone reductase
MKAVRMIPGAQGASLVVQDIPQPQLPPGQIMVRVRAAGLNRGEIAYAEIHRSGDPVTNGWSSPARWPRSAPASRSGARATA